MNDKYSSIQCEPCLSVGEQLCTIKARHYLNQYIPIKHHKWRFKLFIISSVSGYAYKFEIYTGNENKYRLLSEPDLGASGNVVVRLCRNVQRDQFYRVYFDDYYSSIPLILFLAKNGIHSLGTIRRNRIPNCKFPSDCDVETAPRGTSYENVTAIDGVDVSTVLWIDKKILISSYTGQLPIQEVTRFDNKVNRKVSIPCPNFLVKDYKHMGGVDFLDSLIGRYKIHLRTKKWYMRIFYHLIDMTLVNSWILYRQCLKGIGEPFLSLADFRLDILYLYMFLFN